jgi:predicted nucleotidyltransferase
LAGYPVEIAYLHGSVANGTPLPDSDVDIALVLSEVPPPYERLKLELEIQAALEDACQLSNVDVRTINQAPIMAQGPIVQEGILLYNRDRAQRIAFEVLTRKKYFDYRPTAERMQRAFLDHIRKEGLRRRG